MSCYAELREGNRAGRKIQPQPREPQPRPHARRCRHPARRRDFPKFRRAAEASRGGGGVVGETLGKRTGRRDWHCQKRPPHPRIRASTISVTCLGFALPLLSFMTCPTRKFAALSLPSRTSPTGPGFAAMTSSTMPSTSPESAGSKPFAFAIEAGDSAGFSKRWAKTYLA